MLPRLAEEVEPGRRGEKPVAQITVLGPIDEPFANVTRPPAAVVRFVVRSAS